MDVSVIICTYDRSSTLRQTLTSLQRQQLPPSLAWEVMVMDNNSRDDTPAVCEEFRDRLPLRYQSEPRQGKSYALNRAVRRAAADLLVFTDDDVEPAPDWIAQLYAAAQRRTDASFFGGRILPKWEGSPPRWLLEHYASAMLEGVVVLCDEGDAEQPFTSHAVKAKGANLAFRRSVFDAQFRFPEDIGPRGSIPTRGEETELMEQLIVQGYTGVYVPTAVVYHRTPPSRMTEAYVREWHRGHGIYKARRQQVRREHIWLGAPRYVWKMLVVNSARYALTRWVRPAESWLTAEVNLARAWGIITECRRQKRLGIIPRVEPTKPAQPDTLASVIIVTADRPRELERCLSSFYHDLPPRCEIIVVDASGDNQTRNLLAQFPAVRYLRGTTRNMCAQRNLGIRTSAATVVVFADDDIVAHPGWLEGLLVPYADPRVVSVAGKAEEENLPSYPDTMVQAMSPYGMATPITNWKMTRIIEVPNGRGCNMSFRRETLIRVGQFDEGYIGHCNGEEVDVYARLRRLGGRILYTPRAGVTHRPAAPQGYVRSSFNRRYMYYLGRNNGYGNTKLFFGRREFFWYYGWESLQFLRRQCVRLATGIGNNLAVTLFHLAGRLHGLALGLKWHLQQRRATAP